MKEENDEPLPLSERYSLMEDEDWRTRGGNIWNSPQERTVTRVKCRATTCQLVQLVKFMEKHPELAVSHAKPFPGSDELWAKLADHINQFGPPKTYKQCKTTWRDLRKRAFSMQRSRSKKGTGRNLYGMAPKIISLITQAGMAPRFKEDEGPPKHLLSAVMSERRVKRKKLTLTLKIKNEIIQRIDGGENYSQLSREFGVGRSTIYDIYKNRNNIKNAAKLPYKPDRKTLRAAENPELEEKLYQWYVEERKLYPMTGSLIILKARTLHKELTGNDDFMASTGWLDRFKKRRGIVLGGINKGSASSSRPDTPPQREPPPIPTPVAEDDSSSKTEKTKGEQLVIRVTDNLNSKRNVFNRFTTSDGHFENVIVKEEMLEAYNQEEEDPDPPEPELEEEPHESGEMFPQPEAILGSVDEVMEEKNSVIRELNDTLRKFLTEYKTRNALMRERIDLERARLQFDMEVYRCRQMENRVIAVNAANAANVMKTANAMSVANSGNAISVANSGMAISVANSGNAKSVANSANLNNITVGASAGNFITVNAGAATVNTATAVKPKPVITLNPISTRSSGNEIAVKIENTVSVRNANVANATNSANAANSTNVAKVANVENIANAVDDGNAKNSEDPMDET